MEGTHIVSCGMDHSLKIWKLEKDIIQNAIVQSYKASHKSDEKYVYHIPWDPLTTGKKMQKKLLVVTELLTLLSMFLMQKISVC